MFHLRHCSIGITVITACISTKAKVYSYKHSLVSYYRIDRIAIAIYAMANAVLCVLDILL